MTFPLRYFFATVLFLLGTASSAFAATAPSITTQPANKTVTAGATATFTIAASGSPTPTYQWQRKPSGSSTWSNITNGGSYSGATTKTLSVASTTTAMNSDQFRCTAKNSAGSKTSNAATLTVTAAAVAPAITTQPANKTVTVGATAAFSVVATGTPAPTYQWRKNGTAISGATSASYTTPATVIGDNGALFSVVVTNSAGAVTSTNATLTVTAAAVAPAITTQPANKTVTVGATAAFSVVATGTPSPTYQWRKNGTAISGATSASYTTPATVIGDNAALFSVVVTNSAGTVTSTNATLTVNPPANVPPVVSLTAPAAASEFTLPASLNLTATATDSDGTIAKVEFFRGTTKLGESLTPASANTYTFAAPVSAPPGAASLTAKATDNAGGATTSAPVSIFLLSSLPYTTDFEVAEGFTAGSLNNQLGWSVSAGSAQVVTTAGASSGTQSVTLASGTTAAQIQQEFGPVANNPNPVYIDLFVQPVAGTTTSNGTVLDLDSARIAFVKNGATGQFRLLDGDGIGAGTWLTHPTAVTLGTGNIATTWQRLTVRLNYTTKTWDFFYAGLPASTGLKFRFSSATYASLLAIKGATAASARVDDIYLGPDNPLYLDADHDGLSDTWETAHGLNPTVNDANLDADGDGLTNLQEFAAGSDPQNYYNGNLPVITSLLDASGEVGPDGLVSVKVTTSGGAVLVNAPITFTVSAGAVTLSSTVGGTGASTVTVRTDAQGIARTYVNFGTATTATLTASSGPGGTTISLPVVPRPPLSVIDTIPGKRLWLKADVGITADASGRITRWADQSGAGIIAQQVTGANQPLSVIDSASGKKSVRFDGSDDMLGLGDFMTGAPAGEMFIITRLEDFGNTWNGLCHFGNGYGTVYSNTDIWNDFGTTDGSSHALGNSSVLTSLHICNASISSDGHSVFRLNGDTIIDLADQTVGFRSDPILGTDYYNEPYKGDIFEVIVFDRVLTASEREAIGSYLTAKYALPGIVVPAKPSLAIHAITGTTADLSWSVVSGTTDGCTATIERKTGTGSYSTLAEIHDNASYTDKTLTAGLTYTYRVKLRSLAGSSPYSDEVIYTAPATSGPPMAGMRLWLRSTAGISTQGTVFRWADQSGLGNDAQQEEPSRHPASASSQIGTIPVLRFEQAQGTLVNLPNLMSDASAGEAFVVLRKSSRPLIVGLWEFGGVDGSRYPENGSGLRDDFATDRWRDAQAVPEGLTDFHIYNVGGDTSVWFQNINGQSYMRSQEANTVVFRQAPTIGSNFDGDIAEVIIFDRVLNASEREAIGSYLTAKYALPGIVVPAKPTLTVLAVTGTTADLSWSVASGTTAGCTATIERKTGTGSYSSLAEIHDSASYTDKTLTAGLTYTYRVKLRSLAGASPYSDEATIIAPTTSDLPVSGLRLWLRSTAGLPASGPVSRWVDQSGLGNDAVQPVPSGCPEVASNAANGRPTVRFSNDDMKLDISGFMSGEGAGEIFAVTKVNAKMSPLPSQNRLWNFGSDTGYNRIISGNLDYAYSGFGLATPETLPIPSDAELAQYHIRNTSCGDGMWAERINGSVIKQMACGVAFFAPDGQCSLGSSFNGEFAEVIVFNRALTPAERVAIHDYLAAKYGVTLNVPPAITSQPASTSVSVGGPATFSVVASGVPAPTYQWRRNGTTISGATAASYTKPSTVVGDNGAVFSVVVSNVAGSVTSANATLTVNVPPAITSQPANKTVTVGATATFSVVATGTPAPTYQWRKNGTVIVGATSASYTTPATIGADNAAVFSVVVSNVAGSITSVDASLTVNVPASITGQPVGSTVTAGETATFSVVASGWPAPAYQWRKNGIAISGATSASYTTPATVIGDTGALFSVVVSNVLQTVTSDSALLTVNPPPNVPPVVVLIAPATGAALTLPATVTLTANATDSDGTISKVEFFRGSTSLGLGSLSAPSVFSLTLPAETEPGLALFSAKATDNSGDSTSSASASVHFLLPIPYVASFETTEGFIAGDLNNQHGWSVTSGSAQVVTTPGAPSGAQSTTLMAGAAPAVIAQEFGPSLVNPVSVYIDIYTQPVAGADTASGTVFDLDSARVAFVKTGATGQFRLLDGDGLGSGTWVATPAAVALDAGNVASAWQRFTVVLNYTTKTWDFFYEGLPVATGLKFRLNSASYVSSVVIKGAATAATRLDDLYVGKAFPLFPDADHDRMDDTWEVAHGLNPTINDASLDLDGDGVNNFTEYKLGRNPAKEVSPGQSSSVGLSVYSICNQ